MNISKAIAGAIMGAVGVLGAFGISTQFADAAFADAVGVVVAAILGFVGVYAAPKNTE